MERANAVAIGDIEITSVWDGTLVASLESVLRLDPSDAARLVAEEARVSGADPLILPVWAFLIRTGGKLALVDTGSGTTKGATMGHLPASLASLGVAAAAIDVVLMTHLHMDHIGGLIDGHGQPAFPNAEVVLHRDEARYFLDTPDADIDARSRRHLSFQRTAIAAYGNRVRRVCDGEGMVGVTAKLAAGHTPGHTTWQIASRGNSAVVLGDVIHLGAVQLARPASAMIYDVDPDRAATTRTALLAELASSRALVAGAHLPGGGRGRIEAADEGYRFVPC